MVVVPALLLLVTLVVQLGLFFYAQRTALSAATEGLRAARTQEVPAVGRVAGEQRAAAHLAAISGTDLLSDVAVSVASDGTTAQVTVSGRAVPLLPGLSLPVSETVAGEVERFRAP